MFFGTEGRGKVVERDRGWKEEEEKKSEEEDGVMKLRFHPFLFFPK